MRTISIDDFTTTAKMRNSIANRVMNREIGGKEYLSTIGDMYGDKLWVDELDIVNELGGHTGCVNALSWSGSGRLLASGSDDRYLNIYNYQPDSSTAPFSLKTTIWTGHTDNIFAVKFMPHSNDRTLVTASADSQVRIFDLEHAANSGAGTDYSLLRDNQRQRAHRVATMFNGVQYYTHVSTNAKVFESHADSAKRIVTESSPHLFLTCSEDGEVRQWDLRQPSSFYPKPRGGIGFMAHRRAGVSHDASNVPRPLISYKRYRMSLNTISCSGSRPHYITLGGHHSHVFLHDRRMLGRDRAEESGQPSIPTPRAGGYTDRHMGEATRCVRRFAPKKPKLSRNAHVTACKISDANPNNMIASWSGDKIYLFDLVAPDEAKESEQGGFGTEASSSKRVKESTDRKRKRSVVASSSSLENEAGAPAAQAARLTSEEPASEMTLPSRARPGALPQTDLETEIPRELLEASETNFDVELLNTLNPVQRTGFEIGKSIYKMGSQMFSFEGPDLEAARSDHGMPHSGAFTAVLGHAAARLPDIDRVNRTRPASERGLMGMLNLKETQNARGAVRRFVQAMGTLAQALGGRLQTASGTDSEQLESFKVVEISPTEDREDPPCDREKWYYEFLRAIVLWSQGGKEAVVAGFKAPGPMAFASPRFSLKDDCDTDKGIEALCSWLQIYASQSVPILDIDVNRYENVEARTLFACQADAVTAFGGMLKMQLADLSQDSVTRLGYPKADGPVQAIDRQTAKRFWLLKVGRALLMLAFKDLKLKNITRAFGGLAMSPKEIEDREEEDGRAELLEAEIESDWDDDVRAYNLNCVFEDFEEVIDIDEDEDDHDDGLGATIGIGGGMDDHAAFDVEDEDFGEFGEGFGEEMDEEDEEDEDHEHDYADGEDEEELDLNDDEDDCEDDEFGDEYGSEEEDDYHGYASPHGARQELWGDIEQYVPAVTEKKEYSGHCNVQTVKDVNFYGLNDEYVVSGSDDGNLFIWDRKTSKLLNILQGDGETVNVVQGHPYEPCIAASGIDSTIKIFSPDQRAQDDARNGINIASTGDVTHSSIRQFGPRRGESSGHNGLTSARRMEDSYQIMAENQGASRGGRSEALIMHHVLQQLIEDRIRNPGRDPRRTHGMNDDNCLVM